MEPKSRTKNIPLIVGLTIPIFMILFVAASIYLPGIFIKPKQNFLYTTQYNYFGRPHYDVQGSQLVFKCDSMSDPSLNPPLPEIPCTPEEAGKLYLHDVETNTSRSITYAEAQQLLLNSNLKSNDGYEVVRGSSDGDLFSFVFGGGNYDYNARYIRGRNVSKKLNIQASSENDSYYDFRFLGWIE